MLVQTVHVAPSQLTTITPVSKPSHVTRYIIYPPGRSPSSGYLIRDHTPGFILSFSFVDVHCRLDGLDPSPSRTHLIAVAASERDDRAPTRAQGTAIKLISIRCSCPRFPAHCKNNIPRNSLRPACPLFTSAPAPCIWDRTNI